MPETQAVNTVDGTVVWDEAVWDAAYIASPIAVAVSLLAMVVVTLVTLVTQKSEPPLPLTDVDGNPLALENRLGWVSLWSVLSKSGP